MMVVSAMMMMPPSHLLHHCLLCQDLSREHHLLLALHARVCLVVRYLVGEKETLFEHILFVFSRVVYLAVTLGRHH